MTYNLTAINLSSTPLEFFQDVNDLSSSLLGNGWAVVFLVILFACGMYVYQDIKKAILAAGFLSFVVNLIMLAMKLVDWYIPILSLTLVVLGIILLQDKDYST